MELSQPVSLPNHDHQLAHPQLGLQPSPSSPDPQSDLNHTAALQEDLKNLDLGDAETAAAAVEVEVEEKVSNKDAGSESDDTVNNQNEIEIDNENGNENENENESENENGSEIRKRYPFPVRPDAEDCAYYMKTGTCKFGSNCKFNHPVRRKNQAAKEKVKDREDSLERQGQGQGQSQSQIECKYYLRTGGCKFGKACRYNHTRAKSAAIPILELNFLGLPIRPGEKECPYYMRNGSCKYGANCKFNHPDPTAVGSSDPPSGYGNGGSVSSQAASQTSLGSWSSPRALNETASFVPMMFPPTQGVTAQNPEWNGYQAPLYPPERSMHPASAYVMSNPAMETTLYTHNQPQILADEFPERPGQPECSYFLKTGDCKFKSNCKYHHPKNQISKSPPCALSDKGLPLRPDQNICLHYRRYGICKFGPACRFHHPIDLTALSTESGRDPSPPLGNSATTEEAGTGNGNGSDNKIQQPV